MALPNKRRKVESSTALPTIQNEVVQSMALPNAQLVESTNTALPTMQNEVVQSMALPKAQLVESTALPTMQNEVVQSMALPNAQLVESTALPVSELDKDINNLLEEGEQFSRQQTKTILAAKALHETYCSSDERIISAMRHALIKTSVTIQQYKEYRRVYGPCPYCSMGKMPAASKQVLQHDNTDIPGEQFHTDIVFIRRKAYLFSVDNASGGWHLIPLLTKSTIALLQAVRNLKADMKTSGHMLRRMYSDRESVFQALQTPILGDEIRLYLAPPGHHEKIAERNIRTLKDHIDALQIRIKSQYGYELPRQCDVNVVHHVISCHNDLPNSKLPTYSPRKLLYGDNSYEADDYNVVFGEIYSLKEPDNSTHTEKARVGIILNRDISARGTYFVFMLDTGKIVPREIPIKGGATKLKVTDEIKESIQKWQDNYINYGVVEVPPPPEADANISNDTVLRYTGPAEVAVNTKWVVERLPSVTDDTQAIKPSSEQKASYIMQALNRNMSMRIYCHNDKPADEVKYSLSILKERYKCTTTKEHIQAVAEATKDLELITDEDYNSLQNTRMYTSATSPSVSLSVVSNNISFSKLIKQEQGLKAAQEELQQVCEEQVWEPVNIADIPHEERTIYPSHVFGKIKTSLEGDQKYKARIVFDGSKQPSPEHHHINASPTVDITSVMTLISIAAATDANIFAMDVKGAFLKVTRKPDDTPIYMRIAPEVAEILTNIRPEYTAYVNKNGCIYVRIKKAIYGMVESPKLFYDDIAINLRRNGYIQLHADKCVFKKEDKNGTTFLAIWVDDILGVTVTGGTKHKDSLMEALSQRYGKATIQTAEKPGESIKYLNMKIQKQMKGSIRVDQTEYIEKLLNEYNITGKSTYPADGNLFEERTENVEISDTEKATFQSRVMALVYIALRTRPDILCATIYLSTRVSKATEDDSIKLLKVLQYLNHTKQLGRTFNPQENLQVTAMIDASYAIFNDAKGLSGIIVSIGTHGGMVYITARKQKLVAKSSTEAELIALNDGSSRVLWLKDLMNELGYKQNNATVFQDNKSTMYLAESGEGKLGKTKHIQVRYFYIKQLIENNDIHLVHKSTNDMAADILTKPLMGEKFIKFRNELLNESL
jgi:hypothetical protein